VPSRKAAWWATVVGIGGLGALAFAYWFTYEPAPGVRVSWRPGITLEQQEALERKYMLAARRAPLNGSLAYDLLDTTRSNIEALLKDPAVVDTNDIDDEYFRVRLGTDYGDRWMWVAHRTPLLRIATVRWGLIATLAATAVWGLRGLLGRPPAQTPE
jgi:hypothetical protein